jgi:hypothetical protein
MTSLVSSDDLFGENTKEVIRRYQRGHQKLPKRSLEDTKEVIRRYQRGHQKIPKRSSEDTKEVIRRYQRGHHKLWFEEGQTKQWTKDTKEVIRNWFEEGQKKKHNRKNNDRQTTTLKITYRSSRTPIKPSDPNGKQYLLHQFYDISVSLMTTDMFRLSIPLSWIMTGFVKRVQ